MESFEQPPEPLPWTDERVPASLQVGEEIDRGAITLVRRGELVLPQGEKVAVAVKTPLKPKYRDRIEGEYQTLQALQGKARELFPRSPEHFVGNRRMDVGGNPALVMEFLPREFGLYRSAEKLFAENPNRLKEVFEQYLEVLSTAHALNMNMGDKKEADLYFIPENDRLVILDWNVTDRELDIRSIKGNILQGFRFFTGSLTKYWPPDTLEKIKKLEQMISFASEIPSAKEVLAIMHQINNLSLAEISSFEFSKKAAPTERDTSQLEIERRRNYLREQNVNPRLIEIWVDMLEGSFRGMKELDVLKKEIVANQKFFQAAEFLLDFSSFRTTQTQIDAGTWKKYGREWNRDLAANTATLLELGNDAGNEIKETVRNKLSELLADPYVTARYFGEGRTPIPKEILQLAGLEKAPDGVAIPEAAPTGEEKARAQEEERRASEIQVSNMKQELTQKEEEIQQLSEEYRQTWFFQFAKKRRLGIELALSEAEVRRLQEELANYFKT